MSEIKEYCGTSDHVSLAYFNQPISYDEIILFVTTKGYQAFHEEDDLYKILRKWENKQITLPEDLLDIIALSEEEMVPYIVPSIRTVAKNTKGVKKRFFFKNKKKCIFHPFYIVVTKA